MQILLLSLIPLLLPGCRPDNATVDTTRVIEFSNPVKVEINGYDGNMMEPFLSRDGNTLLFNNLNSAPENTNLHWATKMNDTVFQYKGEIAGVNTTDLEGVPTIDNAGNLYFVSDRNYANTLSTLYQYNFQNGTATNVQLISGISKLQVGWVNFDVEVSADGQSLYFVDAQFDQSGNPKTADLVLAQKNGAGFERLPNSNAIMKNINTEGLEYAACISADNLELYFTRVQTPLTVISLPTIFYSIRQNINSAFSSPSKIQNITGFAEAPTISPDQKKLYYHKKENNKFVLYMIRKK
jgi:Tol biopolymer transport system component